MAISKRERSCKRLSIVCKGGRTQQHFKAICDVNSIVEKSRVTGLVSHLNAKRPIYDDVSAIPDYQSALSIVNVASETFSTLSAKVRERFGNDPSRMITFISDKSNYDEAVKLGLLVSKEPVKVPDSHEIKPKA